MLVTCGDSSFLGMTNCVVTLRLKDFSAKTFYRNKSLLRYLCDLSFVEMTTARQKTFEPLHLCTFAPSNKNKTSNLAPIEVKILLCRGSAQKIETDSGTRRLLKTKISAPEKPYKTYNPISKLKWGHIFLFPNINISPRWGLVIRFNYFLKTYCPAGTFFYFHPCFRSKQKP